VISRKEVSLKENARVFLKITVPQSEIQREYDELVKEYCDKAVIKGFRRGKVPAEVLMRKYGAQIKDETALAVIKKGLEEAVATIDEKPLNHSNPAVTEKVELDLAKDFTFEVSYDTFPKVELGAYQGIKAEKPVVAVGPEDLERELAAIREKNSVVKEKQGAVAKGDIVTVDYVELDDEGKPVEGTKRDGFVLEVGKQLSVYQFDDDLIGLKANETKTLTKEIEAGGSTDSSTEHVHRQAKLLLTVKAVKEKILPELNDELAQDVSDKYKTLADLKADIQKRLADTAEERLRDILATAIVDKIMETSKIPVPESMVAFELEQNWNDLVERFNKREDLVLRALKEEGKTKEDLFKDWRPGAEKKIKAELVIGAVEEKEKIVAGEEEVTAEIKKYAEERGLEYDKAKEAYEKMNLLDYLKRSLTRQKTIAFLIDHADVKKGKKLKFLDLLQGSYQ
jgi:trigger factor